MKAMIDLYPYECGRIEAFITEARVAAKLDGRKFAGISIDYDEQGNISVFATGVVTLKL